MSRAMPMSYQLTASLSTGHRMGVLRCGDVMRSANHCSRLSSASPQRSPSAACGTVTRPGHFGSFRTRCCLLRSRKRSLTDFSVRPQPEVGTPAAKRTVNGALDPKRKPEWPQEPSSMLAERLAASHRLGASRRYLPGPCAAALLIFSRTASTLKLAGFWRGGSSLNDDSHLATMACNLPVSACLDNPAASTADRSAARKLAQRFPRAASERPTRSRRCRAQGKKRE